MKVGESYVYVILVRTLTEDFKEKERPCSEVVG